MIKTFSTLKSILFDKPKNLAQIEMNRDTITKLKFISTFQIGQKVDCNNLKIESNNIFTPLKRFLYGDSRDHTMTFLNQTIDRSFEIIQSYTNSDKKSEIILCSNLIKDLQNSVNGLNNIKETYTDDKLFICSIDILIENIHAKLAEIQDKHPDLFNQKN